MTPSVRAACAFFISGALTAACSRAPVATGAAHLVERSHAAMGTEVALTAWTSDDSRAEAAFAAVFGEFDRLEALMSVWREGSDIVRLNAAAGDHPVPVSPEVARGPARGAPGQRMDRRQVRRHVRRAVRPVEVRHQDKDDRIPDRGEVAEASAARSTTATSKSTNAAGTAFLKRKGMRVNLGGIGKGYAVDRAVDILRRRGVRDFMIQAGGDMYVGGTRGDRPWRLGIRDPRGPADRSFAALDLTDGTFSTSGDYERFFMKDGRRYHHILDLSVGEPARGCRSVTLVTERAVIADALAKGVFILGPDAGMALIERLPDVEGRDREREERGADFVGARGTAYAAGAAD